MLSIKKIFFLFTILLALISCSTFTPKPTETPVPTATEIPTPTSTPEPTNTPAPTKVPTQTPIPPTNTAPGSDLPRPSGEPANEWEGIPIMPDALSGEGDSTGYSFIIADEAEDVREYYEMQLSQMGWNLWANGEGETGAVLLFFSKDDNMVTISIIPMGGGEVYVMLIK